MYIDIFGISVIVVGSIFEIYKGALMMLNLELQKKTMQNRLKYYDRVLKTRPVSYQKLKSFVIPRVHRALKKIKNGTYTVCDDCGDTITNSRLKEIPAALLCIDCQKIFEKKNNI